MRILHLSMLDPPHVMGGAELSVAALAETQLAEGHEVAAACTTPGPFVEELRNGVTVFRMPHETSFWAEDWPRHGKLARAWRKAALPFNLRLERHFIDVIARFRPDIVHTHSMVDVTTRCWLAAAHAGVPIVHSLRDYDLLCTESTMFHGGAGCGLRCRLMTMAKRPHHRMIDAVAALSADTLAVHREHRLFTHLAPDRMTVIPNGIAPSSHEARRAGKGPMRLGFLGRISPEKGLDLLIDALRGVAVAQPWELRVGGTAPDGLADRLRVRAAGLPVRFLGQVDSAAFLADLDVLVVPSLWVEPFGRVVGEAYAAGVPVLGADAGGIADMIARVDRDWLFARGDVVDLRRKLERIIEQPRGALQGPASFAPLLRDMTWRGISERYEALYRTL
jgi:glycosyltransferase involved in cell wall biosynthesis